MVMNFFHEKSGFLYSECGEYTIERQKTGAWKMFRKINGAKYPLANGNLFRRFEHAIAHYEKKTRNDVRIVRPKSTAGRHRKDRETRSEKIVVIMTPTDKKLLDEAVRKAEVSRNEFMLQAIRYAIL